MIFALVLNHTIIFIFLRGNVLKKSLTINIVYPVAQIICVMMLTLAVSLPVIASPTVDGKFDPSEGYTTGYSVNFEIDNGATASGGQLWYYQDENDDIYIAFIQPKTLVDNSYGVNAIGWPGDNHSFKHLSTSDSAKFVLKSDGNTVLDFTLDYLDGDKQIYQPFYSGLVDDSGDLLQNAAVSTGLESDVIAAATSLQYNWDVFGGENPEYFGEGSDSPAADENYDVADPNLSDWIFDVIYEVKVDGRLIISSPGETFDISQLSIDVVHDSPTKLGGDLVYPEFGEPIPGGGTEPIPEPTTMLLLGPGIIGLVTFRKKSRRK